MFVMKVPPLYYLLKCNTSTADVTSVCFHLVNSQTPLFGFEKSSPLTGQLYGNANMSLWTFMAQVSKEFSISYLFEPIDVVTWCSVWWHKLHSAYQWPQVSPIYFMRFLYIEIWFYTWVQDHKLFCCYFIKEPFLASFSLFPSFQYSLQYTNKYLN